jgi:hypothetical protein
MGILIIMMTLTDWIGSVGVAMLLIAFFLNIYNRVQKDSYSYLLLNVFGAGLACAASLMLNYTPFVILEGCWTLVSLVSLVRFMNQVRGNTLP